MAPAVDDLLDAGVGDVGGLGDRASAGAGGGGLGDGLVAGGDLALEALAGSLDGAGGGAQRLEVLGARLVAWRAGHAYTLG